MLHSKAVLDLPISLLLSVHTQLAMELPLVANEDPPAKAAGKLLAEPDSSHYFDLTTQAPSPSMTRISNQLTGSSCQSASQMAALFDDFMKFGSVGLHIVNNQGIIVWANEAELQLLGYTQDEYFGKSIADFHVDQNKIGEILATLLSGQKLKGCIAPIRCKDGHTEYVEINSSMRKQDGKCITTRCFSACVTDRVLREQAQLEAMARKKEAEFIREETKKKTRFLRKLCHELRNPLAGVSGNLELLLTELLEADSATGSAEDRLAFMHDRIRGALEYAESAQVAAEHQMLVINDTLSLSRLESTEYEFSPVPVDFSKVVSECVSILGVKATEKGVGVNVKVADEARFVKTDIVWTKQVILNLLSNSVKFTEKGQVDIRVSVLEKDEKSITLEVAVKDTGIGMNAEEQGRLFGVFAQANEKISAQFGGSGLGLHIAKQLIDHTGGNIRVESEKGIGTSFIFSWPCGVLTAEERASVSAETTPDTKKASAMLPLPSAEGVRVLVVDDIQLNRKILSAYLRKRGYTYETAENGKIAFDLHQSIPFDIILTDIDMPVMCGQELTRKLREVEKERSSQPVPIIGISGNVLPEDVKEGIALGMNAYLGKPFKFSELETAMLKYL